VSRANPTPAIESTSGDCAEHLQSSVAQLAKAELDRFGAFRSRRAKRLEGKIDKQQVTQRRAVLDSGEALRQFLAGGDDRAGVLLFSTP